MCEPTTIAIMMVASAALSIIGQQNQAKILKRQADIKQQQIAFRQDILKKRAVAKQQDIASETEREEVRQKLLSDAGARRGGEIRVAQAALGQLVDEGSAADITDDLAGEVAFRKLISTNDSALRKRNIQIEANNIEGEIGLLSFESAQIGIGAQGAQDAANIGSIGTIFSAGASLGSTFKFGSGGGLKFRT